MFQYGDSLYVTDWQVLVIERIQKTTGLHRKTVHSNIGHLMDVKVVSRDHQLGAFPHFSHLTLFLSLLHYRRIVCVFLSGNNTCGVGNGGCSHLCLMRSTYSYVCACPDGSTDTSCSEKPRFDGNSFDVRIESVTFFIFSSRQQRFQLCENNVSLLLIFFVAVRSRTLREVCVDDLSSLVTSHSSHASSQSFSCSCCFSPSS